MKELLDWVKANAKLDANVAQFEEMATKYALPETKEKAWDFMTKNPVFKSALDAEVSRATAAHDVNFTKEKLPDIEKALREKLTKELHPEKTQMEIEFEQMKTEREKEKRDLAIERRTNAYIKKAGEKGFDTEIASMFSVLDDGDEKLDFAIERFENAVNARVDKIAAEKFGGKPPVVGDGKVAEAITRESLATPEGRKVMMEAAKASGGPLQISEV